MATEKNREEQKNKKDLFGVNRLKINLHTHTTRSDGAKTPEEISDLSKKAGYDVIAITDHWNHNSLFQQPHLRQALDVPNRRPCKDMDFIVSRSASQTIPPADGSQAAGKRRRRVMNFR